jgi:hypothetical protein
MDHSVGELEQFASECDRVRRYVLEFLDGELDDPQSRAIAVHIVVCNPCGNRITFEAAFLRTIARAKSESRCILPAAVEERVASLLQEWSRKDV